MSGNWNRKPELTGTSKAHTHFSIRTYAHSTLHLTWPWRQFKTCFFVTPKVRGQLICTVFRYHQLSPGISDPAAVTSAAGPSTLSPGPPPPDSGLRVGGEAVTPTPGGSMRRRPTHFRCISSGNSNLRRSALTPSKLSPLSSNIASVQRPPTPLPHTADNTRPEGTLRSRVRGGSHSLGRGKASRSRPGSSPWRHRAAPAGLGFPGLFTGVKRANAGSFQLNCLNRTWGSVVR